MMARITTDRGKTTAKGTARLVVPGMGSDHCAGLVSTSLTRLDGVADVATNIANHRVTVRFDPALTDIASLRAAVERAGYEVAALDETKPASATEQGDAIAGFLAEARKRLIPYNVFLAADIFGYICWNRDDTGIGQRLEELAPHVDYLSPMLYPSGFQFGIPGYRNPVAHVDKIVALSLHQAARRTGLPPVRFRPWLQAFKDYAFDRRHFTASEIRAQIEAAEHFGAGGWMLWNPRNVYSGEGLTNE